MQAMKLPNAICARRPSDWASTHTDWCLESSLPKKIILRVFATMDLFLDTLPYNAGTTASDALWAGLPVLTLAGRGFSSRVAASLLNAIELPELVTSTAEQYESMAVQLAESPELLHRIKIKLAQNRLSTALFDTRAFAKHLEIAFTMVRERHTAQDWRLTQYL